MKDTDKSKYLMYARLKKVHNISHQSEEYYLDTQTYLFLSTLWEICDSIKEWDKLVENYKERRM